MNVQIYDNDNNNNNNDNSNNNDNNNNNIHIPVETPVLQSVSMNLAPFPSSEPLSASKHFSFNRKEPAVHWRTFDSHYCDQNGWLSDDYRALQHDFAAMTVKAEEFCSWADRMEGITGIIHSKHQLVK